MENGVRRWLVKISEWNPSDDEFASLVALFPTDERRSITRFLKFDDRKRALVSRLLQYFLVNEVLGIPFGEIIMRRTIEGKPYLMSGRSSPFANFNFNVSHHGDYVGIVSEPLCLVGLDIVSVATPRQEAAFEFIKHFTLYFTALEWKNIVHAATSEEMLAEFSRYWSLKEAYVKAIGAGMGYGLHRLEFHHTNWSNISVYIDGVESTNWKFALFKLDGGHWASVAKGLPEKVTEDGQESLTHAGSEKGYLKDVLLVDPGFTLCTVEQLIPKANVENIGKAALFHRC